MDYVTLTAEDEADFARRVLSSAETDHMRHTLEAAAVRVILDGLPAKDPERPQLAAALVEKEQQASTAEGLATAARKQLDATDQPYIQPTAEEGTADAPV